MVGMKRDTLFEHKKATIICEESMGDVYQKLLEPPTKLKKDVEGKQIDIICG
jgi:hypothetical protein